MAKQNINNKGRKSKYFTHVEPNLDRIVKLRRQGYHEDQIAKTLGVGVSTFTRYKSDYEALRGALKKGKEVLIEDLEDTLYRKALGKIKITETKKYIKKTKNGEETRIEETVKELPPDTGAIIFSLKNLAPDRWKDLHESTGFKELEKAMENFGSISDQLSELQKKNKDG